MKMKVGILCLLLTGCTGLTETALDTTLNAVGLGQDKGGLEVDTELVVGDKGIQVGENSLDFDEVDLADNSKMTVTSSTNEQKNELNADTIRYEEGVPYWQATLAGIFLLVLGMFTPQFIVKRK